LINGSLVLIQRCIPNSLIRIKRCYSLLSRANPSSLRYCYLSLCPSYHDISFDTQSITQYPKLLFFPCVDPVFFLGYRQRRQDGLARKLASRLANDFRNFTTGKNVRDVGCSTRCFQAACAEVLPRFAGMHRFLPTFFDMAGFTWCELPVNHRPRLRGTSKYTINNRLWVGLADCFGVLWLRRRAIAWKIAERSGDAGPGTNK